MGNHISFPSIDLSAMPPSEIVTASFGPPFRSRITNGLVGCNRRCPAASLAAS
jgi:hypothetical protein